MATISTVKGAVAPQPTTEKADAAVVRKPLAAGHHHNASPERAPAEKAPALDEKTVREITADLQEALDRASDAGHRIGFRKDERIEGYVIEVRDLDGSLIRQIPPEKVLNLRSRTTEVSGMVVDETT